MTNLVELSDEELNSLTQSILLRYGIDFTCYEPKSLKRRILRLLNNLEIPSAIELWSCFLKDPKFVHTFMNEISVGMTSMFRDPIFWKALQRILQSDFGSTTSIKVWHAGCSTGEEVFSLAILLKEIQFSHRAKAIATDFNQNALAVAQQGIYHKIKMIENENNYKDFNPQGSFHKYFQRDSSDCLMDLSLIAHAKFQYHNLITDATPSPFLFDIILCRNVMIYFDTKAKENLLMKFQKALKPGGLFVIGFFDTMGSLVDNSQFELIDEKAKIFRKV